MDIYRVRNILAHKQFKLAILYRIALQNFLSLLESAVIPLLLIGSLILVGIVLWESRQWYAAAGQIQELNIHIQAKNEIMRTLAQILGGAFILTGLYFTAKNVFVSRRAQITDRFADALEKLSDTDNILKRIGGIHALESIAKDSPADHWRIMEIFTDFIRINTTDKSYIESQNDSSPENRKPRADIQQILNAIGRRSRAYGIGESRRLDLTGANLDGADLRGANLEGVIFRKADLCKATFLNAHLRGAIFSEAKLEKANFNLADLKDAVFYQADLKDSKFRHAILDKTSFAKTQMQNASFEETRLKRVYFTNAVLDDASFEGACLNKCDFSGAKVNRTKLKGAVMSPSIGLSESQIKLEITE